MPIIVPSSSRPASTIKLQDTLNWVNLFCGNILVGATTAALPGQPFLQIATIVQQRMLQPPLRWSWNRVVTGFVCKAGIQDYKLGNWLPNNIFPLGLLVVDTNGNSQQVTVSGTTSNPGPPVWNVSTGGTTTDNTVTWTNLGPIAGSPSSTYTCFYIEKSEIQDIGQTPAKWFEMSSKISLGLDTAQSRPINHSLYLDDGQGNLTFRLMPVPGKAYPVSITMQQKPVVYTNLQSLWGIPDQYNLIYSAGALAWAKAFQGDMAGFQIYNQQFIAGILAAQEGLTETEINLFISSNQTFNAAQLAQLARINSGVQGSLH